MSAAEQNRIARQFQELGARDGYVRLEGFHALKHALRFGAEVDSVVSSDPESLARLTDQLAPELADRIAELTTAVAEETYRNLGPYAHHTQVVAVAVRPEFALADALDDRAAPVVLLEDPRHLGNLGAVVRVAAGGAAAGVLTTGPQDPWDPVAVRGSAGLHFALPVGRVQELDTAGRPLLALDPDGEDLDPTRLPADAVLAFGTERHGLSEQLLERADARLKIPMRPGVSSLNLATSVAAVLFAWRLVAAGRSDDVAH